MQCGFRRQRDACLQEVNSTATTSSPGSKPNALISHNGLDRKPRFKVIASMLEKRGRIDFCARGGVGGRLSLQEAVAGS
jgi:hypothetical protein